MMLSAKPLDLKGLGVIRMVSLDRPVATNLARLWNETTGPDCDLHRYPRSLLRRRTFLFSARDPGTFWKPHRIGKRPSRFYAAHERGTADAQVFCPGRKRLRLSIESNLPVAPLVPRLRCAASPSDISGSIVPIIVDSIQGQSIRWSHVSQEPFKGLEFGCYLDAAASVARIRRIVGILATAQHVLPYPIIPCTRFTVSPSPIPDFYGAMTATGNGFSRHECLGPHRFGRRTAIALAPPACSASRSGRPLGHGQLAESLAGKIAEPRARLPVFFSQFRGHADLVRSAGLRIAVQEIRSSHGRFLAALATTEPIRLTPSRKCQSQNGQLAERLTRQVRDAGAPARSCVSGCEIRSSNQLFFSALASAMPADFAAARIGAPLGNRKSSKGSTCQVLSYPWHDLNIVHQL